MNIKNLDKRQRLIIAALLLIVIIFLSFLLLPLWDPKGDQEGPERENAVGVIPEADLAEGEDTKTGSYRRSSLRSDYWESLAEEPSSGESPINSPNPRRDRRGSPASVEDVFGDCLDEPVPEEQPVQKARPSAPSAPRKETRTEPREVTPSDNPPEAPQPAISRSPVKRTGAVSSLDEDVAADLGSGFSTLDGTDRWVGAEDGKPYRCMFTRDEKVRSGERITLRLLEDLVIGGVHIPRNTHLQGVATITERLEVKVTSLDIGGRILALSFEAYDTDGGKGIYCSDLSAAAKAATDQAVSTASTTLNSRLGRVARDAATVGASIIRSRSGEATVSVPAGYTFYIIDSRQ